MLQQENPLRCQAVVGTQAMVTVVLIIKSGFFEVTVTVTGRNCSSGLLAPRPGPYLIPLSFLKLPLLLALAATIFWIPAPLLVAPSQSPLLILSALNYL